MAGKKTGGDKKPYKVLSHLTHDGDTFGPGCEADVVALTEAEAAALGDKVVQPLEEKKAGDA